MRTRTHKNTEIISIRVTAHGVIEYIILPITANIYEIGYAKTTSIL